MSNVKDIKGATKVDIPQKIDRLRGVEFKNCDTNSRLLHGALEKLDNYTGFDQADMSRFNKIKSAFDTQTKEVTRVWQKMLKKHCHMEPVLRKDKETGELLPIMRDDGKPATKPRSVPLPNGRGSDFDYKDRKAFFIEYKALMDTPFTVEAYRLLTADLMKAGLTPKEIRACAKILSDVDPELVKDAQVFDDEEEEEMEESDDDTDTPPEPIPGSSLDMAPEAPNEAAAASNP